MWEDLAPAEVAKKPRAAATGLRRQRPGRPACCANAVWPRELGRPGSSSRGEAESRRPAGRQGGCASRGHRGAWARIGSALERLRLGQGVGASGASLQKLRKRRPVLAAACTAAQRPRVPRPGRPQALTTRDAWAPLRVGACIPRGAAGFLTAGTTPGAEQSRVLNPGSTTCGLSVPGGRGSASLFPGLLLCTVAVAPPHGVASAFRVTGGKDTRDA